MGGDHLPNIWAWAKLKATTKDDFVGRGIYAFTPTKDHENNQ
jgi:hypothetical protein